MAHVHIAGGKPCPLPTRKECDEVARWSDHYHPGVPCEMWLKPGNKTQTCRLAPERKAEYLAALFAKARGEGAEGCLACEYGGPHHGGSDCKRRGTSQEVR